MKQSQDLATRLERLERQNRRLVRWGGALLAATAAGWAMSMAPVCKTVWAERFVLQDARGGERAVLTAYETGGVPELTLSHGKGKAGIKMGVDERGGYLTVFDADGSATRYGVQTEREQAERKEGDQVAWAR